MPGRPAGGATDKAVPPPHRSTVVDERSRLFPGDGTGPWSRLSSCGPCGPGKHVLGVPRRGCALGGFRSGTTIMQPPPRSLGCVDPWQKSAWHAGDLTTEMRGCQRAMVDFNNTAFLAATSHPALSAPRLFEPCAGTAVMAGWAGDANEYYLMRRGRHALLSGALFPSKVLYKEKNLGTAR